MKKVGIISFTLGKNYGSAIQSYSLKTAIDRIEGYEAHVLHYEPRKYGCFYSIPGGNEKINATVQERVKKFELFEQNDIKVDQEKFTYLSSDNCPDYEYFVTGSDQLWNPKLGGSCDGAYYLDFTREDQKRIAYAVSVGLSESDPALRNREYLDVLNKNLPCFKAVSLRESSALPYIQKFTDKTVQCVLDPVFLLDTHDYDNILGEEDNFAADDNGYILLYFLEYSPLFLNLANMMAKKYNCRVEHFMFTSASGLVRNPSTKFRDGGPKDFISAIKHARFIITDSFHCTCFSILYHKNFYSNVYKNSDKRIEELLGNTGLSDRILKKYINISYVSSVEDFCVADEWINEQKVKSLRFLRSALDAE